MRPAAPPSFLSPPTLVNPCAPSICVGARPLGAGRDCMSTEVWYRKWRPRRFDDVAGQEHITRTLANAVAGGRIAHAYLFCGPRGTGKTSTARILAKAANCRE